MTAIRLRGPADVLASLPYQLGYHPEDSVVVLALSDGVVGLVERLDLPPPSAVLRGCRFAGPAGAAVRLRRRAAARLRVGRPQRKAGPRCARQRAVRARGVDRAPVAGARRPVVEPGLRGHLLSVGVATPARARFDPCGRRLRASGDGPAGPSGRPGGGSPSGPRAERGRGRRAAPPTAARSGQRVLRRRPARQRPDWASTPAGVVVRLGRRARRGDVWQAADRAPSSRRRRGRSSARARTLARPRSPSSSAACTTCTCATACWRGCVRGSFP